MHNYLNLLQHILKNGTKRMDRTGTGTLSVFGHQMRFNLEEAFPLVTTKRIHLKSVIHELLWFLSGDTNIQYLNEHGVSIWDEWADEHGELGPIYGKQWRSWESPDGSTIDQISDVIKSISTNPDSRRHIVNAWNVADVGKVKVSPPPCHVMFQFYVANGKLSCMLTQRSADVFLGVPFNIASYSLLTHMVANQCDLSVGEFIWSGGDCHIYSNHIEQVNTQLSREPLPLPTLKIKRKPESIFEYQFDDFDFVNYQYHEKITAPIAV